MKKTIIFLLVLSAAFLAGRFWRLLSPGAYGDAARFATQNGDVNGDHKIDLTDAVYIIRWAFQGGPEPVALAQGNVLTDEVKEILSHFSLVETPVESDGTKSKTIRTTCNLCTQ